MKWENKHIKSPKPYRSLLILRNAFLGTRRFESFQQNLGAACHVLSERLIENNILVKISYVQRQQRYEYQFN